MDRVGICTGVGIVALSFLFWFIKWFNDRWFVKWVGSGLAGSGVRLPPGSMGWPLIGEMIDFLWYFKFLSDPEHFIQKRKSRYGDTGIYRTHLLGDPCIVTCSPEFNKEILNRGTEDGSFGPGFNAQLLGPSSAAVSSGLLHKKIRSHIMEAFHSPSALNTHLATAQPVFISAFEDWAGKGKIVALDEIKAVTFTNMCDVLVSFRSKERLEEMKTLYSGFTCGLRATAINIPGTAFHYALKCREKLSNILLNEMRRRKEHGHPNYDFLQSLMESVDENGNKLTESEIKDNIVSIILGGYESTSNVMTWALYYMAKHSDILGKVKEESRCIQKSKSKDELLMPEDIVNMKYTSKVAEELIRLANVSPFIMRRVKKDNVVINGYRFPKDWKVLVWTRSIHLDSRYFPNALSFNPDRWENFEPKPGVYSVFGGGPKVCPGNNFARVQLMMFLYHVCLKYRWELLNPDAGKTILPLPVPKDGVVLNFRKACLNLMV